MAQAITPKEKPVWATLEPIVMFDGELEGAGIFELATLADREQQVKTLPGHCIVWNYDNMRHEDGYRLYTVRDKDGFGRVTIQTRLLDILVKGHPRFMYCGGWQNFRSQWGARTFREETMVPLTFDDGWYGSDSGALKAAAIEWWKSLPIVE